MTEKRKTARERAAAIFLASDGQVTIREIVRQLRLENYDDINGARVGAWRKEDQWDDDIVANRAIRAATEGAMELSRAIGNASYRALARVESRGVAPTHESALDRIVAVADAFGAMIIENLPHIEIKSVAHVVALANAMAVSVEAAIEMGKYVGLARERESQPLGTDEDGRPLAGDIRSPEQPSNVIEALRAFKKRG